MLKEVNKSCKLDVFERMFGTSTEIGFCEINNKLATVLKFTINCYKSYLNK